MNEILLGGSIGVIGSILGAIAGAIITYKLTNKSAKIKFFVASNLVYFYYLKSQFCIYLPVTITNEGNKGTTISDIKVYFKSHAGQTWELKWYWISKEVHDEERWLDIERAKPLYIYGNSGADYVFKFIENDPRVALSDVILLPGEYSILLKYRDESIDGYKEENFKIAVNSHLSELLNERRNDLEDNSVIGVYLES
jgi:hypothetical protein